MQHLQFKRISIFYLLLIFSLFLYSYTQVDLNLTLSQWSVWQQIQMAFQHIGWFQRPLSTAFYVTILFSLFIFYLLFLELARRNKISTSQFWWLVGIMSIVLLFSYNAFSYDLFNYMFDARIVTLHHQNPYIHKALDYSTDPWINFMRWTHRTYPYGPIWLMLTIPLSFIGFQFFLPTLFLFKSLMVISFLGTVYFIGKILEKLSPQRKLLGMVLFAFNPLVIIESLVSGHHDIVMMALSLWSIYLILNTKYIRSFLLLFLSIGIKFASLFLLPIFIFIASLYIHKKIIDWNKLFLSSILLLSIAIIFSSIRTELQPWYFLWVLPFIVLLPHNRFLTTLSIVFSLGLTLHYVPFLYTGNWDPPIPTIKLSLTVVSLLLGIVIWYIREKVI